MSSWGQVVEVAPDLAASVQARFEAYGLALLATLRRDGSPRISGVEPLFAHDDLWIGMMPELAARPTTCCATRASRCTARPSTST